MPSRRHPDLRPLFLAACDWVERNLGDDIPILQIILHLGHGMMPVTLPLPPRACLDGQLKDGPDDDAGLSEMECEVMQVFREADEGEVLAREEIARRVGCEPTTRLAEALGRLVRMKRLVNRRPGYALA